MPAEEMSAFFDARADGYDDHRKGLGYPGFFPAMARLISGTGALHILDLGCGTGLELDEVFHANPEVRVTGIDLSGKMLDRLREKHAAKAGQIEIIRADYMSYDYPENSYDYVISAESLHHFTHEEKLGLYRRIFKTLKPGGRFVELDYVAEDQAAEDAGFAEKERQYAEAGLEGLHHIDTPCTVANEVRLLGEAGFSHVDIVRHEGTTALLTAGR
jgi:tRNA (cmo5U34)-methyltransferase